MRKEKRENNLRENNELAKIDLETAKVLNNFFFQNSTEPLYLKIFKRRTFSK